MNYQGKKIDFPAKIELNLNPIAEMLEQKMETATGALKGYYSEVLNTFKDNPWLRKAFDAERLVENPELLEEIAGVAFPSILTGNEIKALTAPWNFTPLYMSARLQNMLKDAGEDFTMDFKEFETDEMYRGACSAMLAMHYHFPVPKGRPSFVHIPNVKTGKTRCYRMTINADYLRIKPNGDAPVITKEDFLELIDNSEDIDLWKKKFPPDSWTISGCLLVTLVDINVDNIINRLTNHLLTASVDGMQKIENDISELLDVEVRMSFVGLEGSNIFNRNHQFESMMLGKERLTKYDETFCQYAVCELIENRRFLAVPNIKKFHKQYPSPLSTNLMQSGMKSYFAIPIIYNDENLGFLELGAKEKGALNATAAIHLEEVIPLLAVAGYRLRQEFKNKVEAVIQEEYTTIHPSVKWRFEEEANLFINAENNNDDYQLMDLSFNDVYPLYGQLDIRSSSTIRNKAVKNDLLAQLHGARNLVHLAKQKHALLIYDELEFVIDKFIYNLNTEMISSSEQEILRFLNKELEPTMEHHTSSSPELSQAFTVYKNSLHPDLQFVYNERKEFDESVNLINKTLARYIDEKQDEAQAMFPHYFERYKTDGLEFNIYIGESIAPEAGFHISHVHNLRLWQLMVMVEMERMYKEEQKNKKTPLEVASLILAFSNSISVQFRMDEKRFDVEGAYNARYEIIKKRIDKAHIKDTNERITQAGKMVVVYANDSDEREYLRYFKFLQGKGYLSNEEPERLYLENLQGVSGLRALRVGVNYSDGHLKSEVTIDEIMAEIEEGS